jgi:hypothetical protein
LVILEFFQFWYAVPRKIRQPWFRLPIEIFIILQQVFLHRSCTTLWRKNTT